jgi:hypothetical protein
MQKDMIENILENMPEKVDGGDMVDIIVNMVDCYSMREDWLTIAICVGHILNQINEMEQRKTARPTLKKWVAEATHKGICSRRTSERRTTQS